MSGIPDRWLMLFILFLARAAMGYQFQTVASVGPFLVDSFAIDFALLGTLIGLYMLPGIPIALPGGILGQRFGAKSVVLMGLALMAAGGLLMASNRLAFLFAGRFASGMGGVLINVLMTKMITDWFEHREIVTAMALFVASWPFGIALGLISFSALAAAYGWAAVMQAAALAALACLLLVALLYRAPLRAVAEPNRGLQINLSRREWLVASFAGVVWGSYNAAYIVLISFLPDLFMARGYSLTEASQVVSLLAWVLIPSLPLSGYLAEQLDRPNLLMIGGFGTVAVAAAALPFVSAPAGAFAVIVLVIGLPAGLIMALPAQALRLENRAAGMGVFYTCHYAGMAVLPGLAGMVRDLSGSPDAPAAFSAAMMIAAALGLFAFRLASRERPS